MLVWACQSISSYKLFIITLITIITKIKRNRKKIIKKGKRKMGKDCNLIQLVFFFTTTDILIYFRDDPTKINEGIFIFKNT